MASQRAFRRHVSSNSAIGRPIEIPADHCTACLEPSPCRHVTIVDGSSRTWVLTASEFSRLTQPLPQAWSVRVHEEDAA